MNSCAGYSGYQFEKWRRFFSESFHLPIKALMLPPVSIIILSYLTVIMEINHLVRKWKLCQEILAYESERRIS